MKKNIVCIECPKGCLLSVDIENCRVVKVEGNQCPKGEKYAASEIENPLRILTSAVLAEGLSLRMVPVRTSKPMPKSRMYEAMGEIKKIRLRVPVKAGDVISADFLGLGIELISTREATLP
jgi:CxxC motif-containing protein